jgi:hypothetical protein
MNQRPPEEIVQGLRTTADKIRALAHANHGRTEISKIAQHLDKIRRGAEAQIKKPETAFGA